MSARTAAWSIQIRTWGILMKHLRFLLALLAIGGSLATARAQQPPAKPPPDAKPVAQPPATKATPPVSECPPAACLPTHPLDGRIIVFVANGAGGGTSLSDNLQDIVQEQRAPLVILTVNWSQTG